MTVTRLSETAFLVVTPAATRRADEAWLRSHLGEARAVVTDVTAGEAALAVMGPRACEVLALYPFDAPFAAIDAIEAAFTSPFPDGSLRERELFAECVTSIGSKALRHLFFAEREAAKVAGVPKEGESRLCQG